MKMKVKMERKMWTVCGIFNCTNAQFFHLLISLVLVIFSVYNIFRIFTIFPHSTRSDKEELFFHHCARRLYFSSIIIVIFSEECLQWISIFHISVFMDDGVRSWHQSRARAIDESSVVVSRRKRQKQRKKSESFTQRWTRRETNRWKWERSRFSATEEEEKIFKFDISINHIRRFSFRECDGNVEFQKIPHVSCIRKEHGREPNRSKHRERGEISITSTLIYRILPTCLSGWFSFNHPSDPPRLLSHIFIYVYDACSRGRRIRSSTMTWLDLISLFFASHLYRRHRHAAGGI